MKCTKCGHEINENQKFCIGCGAPAPETAPVCVKEAADSPAVKVLRRFFSGKLFLTAVIILTVFYALSCCIGSLPAGFLGDEFQELIVSLEQLMIELSEFSEEELALESEGFYVSSGDGVEALALPALVLVALYFIYAKAKSGAALPKWAFTVLFVILVIKTASAALTAPLLLVLALACSGLTDILGEVLGRETAHQLPALTEFLETASGFLTKLLLLYAVSLIMYFLCYLFLCISAKRISDASSEGHFKKDIPVAAAPMCLVAALADVLMGSAIFGFEPIRAVFYILLAVLIIKLRKELSNESPRQIP